MEKEKSDRPRPVTVKQIGSPARDAMGPLMVDQAIRQAITHCWMIMPEEKRSRENVEREIRRLVERALEDLAEDATAFGFSNKDQA